MKGINQAHYIGSLTQDPELKYTPGGLAILEMTVAGKQEVVTSSGEEKRLPFYNRCKAVGKYAEALADGLKQGDVVSVHGRLEYRSWEDEAGDKRSTVETVVTTLQTLEGHFVTEDDSRGQPVLMRGFNQVTLGGNLTREAELRHTAGGASVVNLSVAVNERFGEGQEKVGYFNLQAWGELAQVLGEGVKGQGIIGVGRLVNDSWEDKEGNKRYGTKVELERAHFVAGGQTAKTTPKRKASNTPSSPDVDASFPPEDELPFSTQG